MFYCSKRRLSEKRQPHYYSTQKPLYEKGDLWDLVLILVSEICEEVVALIINNDKCREVLNVNLTYSLHT